MPTLPFRDYYVEQTPELRGVYCLCWAGCRSWCLNKELPPQSTHGVSGACTMVGGSLRDVQMLAGHAALSTTQRHIEADVEAQRKVVELI